MNDLSNFEQWSNGLYRGKACRATEDGFWAEKHIYKKEVKHD